MNLKKIIEDIPEGIILESVGLLNIPIQGITIDSRKIQPGYLFVAVRGLSFDGHDFIGQAIENGAVAVAGEVEPSEVQRPVVYLQCRNTKLASGWLASAYFGHPSSKLCLVGITGTNGKTTTASLLYRLFEKLGYKSGLISTIENWIHNEKTQAGFTTPFPVELNELLDRMVRAGCSYAFMEVSSHAADQDRIAGLSFSGGVFTNITLDHTDYHKDQKSYIRAKKKFFDNLDKHAFALVNTDDRNGEVMVQNCAAKVYRYSLKTVADYKARLIYQDLDGMQLKLNEYELHSRLTGRFNVYNLLAVYGVADLTIGGSMEAVKQISSLSFVEGRFQLVRNPEKRITGIVDYAHTPNALENVLTTIRNIKPKNQLITVVGCGGNRDKAKRPLMAKISVKYSDLSIFTSDNPRSEEPSAILDDMVSELKPKDARRVLRIEDRKEAIKASVHMAEKDAVILVAGKGHEKYQESKGSKIPFDDIEILKALLLEDIKE